MLLIRVMCSFGAPRRLAGRTGPSLMIQNGDVYTSQTKGAQGCIAVMRFG